MPAGRRFVVAAVIAIAVIMLPDRCSGQAALRQAVSGVSDSASRAQLSELYGGWSWRLLWQGDPIAAARADTLLAWLDRAGDDGLDPAAYDAAALRAGRSAGNDSARADADIRFSLVFFRFGRDLAVGRVSPSLIDSLWDGTPAPPGLVAVLSRAIERNDLSGALRTLRPPDGRYAALRETLLWYRRIAGRGGWPVLPDGPDLRMGDRGPRVAALRARLSVTEQLVTPPESGDAFDADVTRALRRFQSRMGITPDGVAGPVTREALNVPVEGRITTLEVNLERWRWVPRNLGARYIIVNIPAYTLELHDGDTTFAFRAIVGRRDRPTPITNAWMDGVTFGPEWNVPRSIALQEVVPLEVAHPGYLRDGGFRVLRLATGAPVDPDSVDWRSVDTAGFPYRLVQGAGPENPLGTIRFDVRDPFNVAIHDTPRHALFDDRVRIFSHGCVRLDRAAVLAAHLLPEWSLDDVTNAMQGPPGRTIVLRRRVRVLLTYQTAWVESDGGVAFRDDVYGWDDELSHALLRIGGAPGGVYPEWRAAMNAKRWIQGGVAASRQGSGTA
jgi:murein L,D-transpeptidase YcbB/YkuD